MDTATQHIVKPKSVIGGQQQSPRGLGHAATLQASRGGTRAKLMRRQWTTCKRAKRQPNSAVECKALPFMEISIAVQDTVDMIRSSVEEEIVFQATFQVPAHHAIACRIEAYGTPFNAPHLQAEASHWSEDDKQFAACLAAPPELEEHPSFTLTRTATFVQQRLPGLREAPALASLSFSVRQRKNETKTSGEVDLEHDQLPDQLGERRPSLTSSSAALPGDYDNLDSGFHSSHRRSLEKPATGSHRRSFELMTAAGAAHSSTHLQPVIMEDVAFDENLAEEEHIVQARERTSSQQQQQQQQDDHAQDRALSSRLQSRRGLIRLESLGLQERQQRDIELAVEPGARGLASLVGVGYILVQQWAERFQCEFTRRRHINEFSAILQPRGGNAHLVVEQQDGHPLAEVPGTAPCVYTPAAVQL